MKVHMLSETVAFRPYDFLIDVSSGPWDYGLPGSARCIDCFRYEKSSRSFQNDCFLCGYEIVIVHFLSICAENQLVVLCETNVLHFPLW